MHVGSHSDLSLEWAIVLPGGKLRFGKKGGERDKHEKINARTWALVLKPAWAHGKLGPYSHPVSHDTASHGSPWHSSLSIQTVLGVMAAEFWLSPDNSLPASCGNTVGSLPCHLSADFGVNSDLRRPHGRVPAWLPRFCNRSWKLCCGKSSSCTSLLA